MKFFIVSLLIWLSASTAWAAESMAVDTGKVTAQLVTSHDEIAPGETFHVTLRTVLDDHWHTYWRNPGDSGEPVQITWDVPDTLTHSDIIWPIPKPVPTGPIINYGFEGVPLFPTEFTLSDNAVPGSVVTIRADVYYLVCKDVCIPEQAKLSLPLLVGDHKTDTRWIDEISNAVTLSPIPGEAKAGVVKSETDVSFTFIDLPADADLDQAYFFPFDQGIIDHSAPQTLTVGDKGAKIQTTPGYHWDEGTPDAISGILKFTRGGMETATEVSVSSGVIHDIGKVKQANLAAASGITLGGAIIGAIIGGLILNLMPCVFPVISIKALSIAKTAHADRGEVRKQGWLYTAGVIAMFMALTAFLLILKAGGTQLGWGFQLQSPKLIAALAVLLFIIGLNLIGVFEVGSGLQNTGAELTHKKGWSGSFFTGALAVIVATPCTAPFMAGAIGYALAQPAIITIAVFMSLAIGFALPFLLLCYAPNLLKKLPKPGPWMKRFQEFLAFPMFGAVIWLLWVVGRQTGADGTRAVLMAMLAFGFAIWFFKRRHIVSKGLGVMALAGMVVLPLTISSSASAVTLETDAWSPQRVTELRAEGKNVFVDFTADWCVTCKVNEKLVLKRSAAKKLFEETNTAFLIADWTNKNDEIAQELARHGHAGVPLYLVYPAGHNPVSPEILPQILTQDVLRTALEGAKSQSGS